MSGNGLYQRRHFATPGQAEKEVVHRDPAGFPIADHSANEWRDCARCLRHQLHQVEEAFRSLESRHAATVRQVRELEDALAGRRAGAAVVTWQDGIPQFASLEDAESEAQRLIGEMASIDNQLADPALSTQLGCSDYDEWRRRAKAAKRWRLREYLAVKTWIGQEKRRRHESRPPKPGRPPIAAYIPNDEMAMA